MFGLFKKTKPPKNKPVVRKIVENFNNVQLLADYFKQTTGVSFEKQLQILKSKLISFCKQKEIHSFSECLDRIKADRSLNQQLVNYLTTNETYFYREFSQIQQLVTQVVDSDRTVDILCLPCSTGEEPYSIAIALLEAGVASSKFRLLGIDINTSALERAQIAIYNERNVSKMPGHLVQKYFTAQDQKFSLNSNIKSLVRYQTLNLFDQSIQTVGKFDFILSRNMLIYFDMETKSKASKILQSLLKDKNQPIFYGHADLY